MFKHKHKLQNEAATDGGGDGGGGTPAAPAAAPVTPPADPTPPPVPSDWRAALPPELKDSPALADVKDIGSLAKQFVDTKAMVGASVRVPTSDAGAEAVEAFRTKILEHNNLGLMVRPDPENPDSINSVYDSLGRPADTSGYVKPETVDAEMFGALAEVAHKEGLNNKQYAALTEAHAAKVGEVLQARENTRMEGVKQLEGEWGLAFGEKVSRAADVVKLLGGHEGLEAAFTEGKADAQTLRLFNTIAEQLGKEGTEVAQQLGRVTTPDPAELKQRFDEITQRMLTETTLTPTQYEDLKNKRTALMEQIQASR